GERRGELLEPVDPGYLLDQVGLAGDVPAAQRRHGDIEAGPLLRWGVGRLLGLEVEGPQDLRLTRAGNRNSEDRPHPALAQADAPRLRRDGRSVHTDDVHGAGRDGSSAELDHESGGERLGLDALLGSETLLEAGGG